jgi:hypothetical protein
MAKQDRGISSVKAAYVEDAAKGHILDPFCKMRSVACARHGHENFSKSAGAIPCEQSEIFNGTKRLEIVVIDGIEEVSRHRVKKEKIEIGCNGPRSIEEIVPLK